MAAGSSSAPFLVFALAGGAVPLPLTVMELLAIDLGTDTLPALALSREPAEPGLMDRPPRPRTQGVISGGMLARAWGFLGIVACQIGTAFAVRTDHASLRSVGFFTNRFPAVTQKRTRQATARPGRAFPRPAGTPGR
jgi:magnesium-transporting ATPase (P-type)